MAVSVFKTISYLFAAALLALPLQVSAADDDGEFPSVSVPRSWNLQAEAQQARAGSLPLLLVFSAEDCEFCQVLEANILNPMMISGDYDDKVVMRRIMTDSHLPVQDFEGRRIDMDQLSDRYGIKVTPTVLIVDHAGRELAPRVIGVNTIEMYSAYLDRAIDVSRQLLRQTNSPSPSTPF